MYLCVVSVRGLIGTKSILYSKKKYFKKISCTGNWQVLGEKVMKKFIKFQYAPSRTNDIN